MPETAWRVALEEVSGVVRAWAKLSAKLSVTTSHLKLRWPLELHSASWPIQEFQPIGPAGGAAASPSAAELQRPIPPARRWPSQQRMEMAMLTGPHSFQRPARIRSPVLQMFSTARPAAAWIRISFSYALVRLLVDRRCLPSRARQQFARWLL